MDHSEALKLGAIERYVLGDLSVSEVEEFERHFFDCPQCSEELRTLTILQDNARAAYIEHGPGPFTATQPAASRGTDRAGWWRAWRTPRVLVPALAGVVLASLAGYEAGLSLHRTAPQPVSEYALYAASRGDLTPITPPKGAQFYTLYMDRTWDREYGHYRAAFLSEPGSSPNQLKPMRYSISLPAPGPGRELHVLIPARALPAGRYVLVIYGLGDAEDDAGKETEVARYPFSLRFE